MVSESSTLNSELTVSLWVGKMVDKSWLENASTPATLYLYISGVRLILLVSTIDSLTCDMHTEHGTYLQMTYKYKYLIFLSLCPIVTFGIQVPELE